MLGRESGEAWTLTPWLARSEDGMDLDASWDDDAPDHVTLVVADGDGVEVDLDSADATRLLWSVMTDQGGRA